MDLRTKIRSSRACKKRLEELFQPTVEKLEKGEFDVEGGSDAYDEAINSVKEAYFATPDLGPMMNDQWNRFLEEITNSPLEMVDLDEPDDIDQPTDQVPHLNNQVPQGNEAAGALSGIAQTPPGDTEEDLLQRIPDPDLRAAFAKILKDANMDKKRKTSTDVCKARLDEVFEPIKQKLDTDAYDGEEGYSLYRTDKAEAIEAYQNTPNLGLIMKGITLDDYLDAIHSERPIEKMDENAKRWAEKDQAIILKLLTAVMEHFQAFRKLFKAWLDNRSDNINWLRLKADSLDEKQKKSNRIVAAGASVGAASTVAGLVIISVVLAPVTFGASLAIGFGVGSAVVGIGAGVTNLVTQKQKRKYDTNDYDEELTRLKIDKEQTDEMMSGIIELSEVANKIQKELKHRADDGASGQEEATSGIRTQLNSSTRNDYQTPSSHTAQSGAEPATSGGPTTKLSSTPQELCQRRAIYDCEDLWNLSYHDDRTKEQVSIGLVTGNAVVVGGDGVGIGIRIGLQITDEVVAAAKLAAVASNALGGISVCFGVVSLVLDAITLVRTIKDMKDGSKSKLATSFREMADKLEQQVEDVVSTSRGIEKMVNRAEDVLTPLLKKYPLTVIRKDNE